MNTQNSSQLDAPHVTVQQPSFKQTSQPVDLGLLDAHQMATACQNIRRMRYLAKLAKSFNDADIPLMALKGAALFFTLYDQPHERSMCDLDLLIRPQDADAAIALLQATGAKQSQTLLQNDFFPRFYYEAEFTAGQIFPVVMDLHIRPFRPLRYSRLVPDDALWTNAKQVSLGDATIFVPSHENMLIHLTTHLAIHGSSKNKWSRDIIQYIQRHSRQINWEKLTQTAKQWHLSLPILRGIGYAEKACNRELLPQITRQNLAHIKTNWRDKLALWQAPKDDYHPVRHVIANCLTTPDLPYVLQYLKAVMLPSAEHMYEWYTNDHFGWLPIAHFCRWTRPFFGPIAYLWQWAEKYQVQRDENGQLAVVAKRTLCPGQVIGHYSIGQAGNNPQFIVYHETLDGQRLAHGMRGKLRFLQSSTKPNAKLEGFKVIALRHIRAEKTITIAPDRCTKIHQPSTNLNAVTSSIV